jgi:hypothetical protein
VTQTVYMEETSSVGAPGAYDHLPGLAGQFDRTSYAPLEGRVDRLPPAAPSYTVAGGTSGMNRNMIAARRPGLPRT